MKQPSVTIDSATIAAMADFSRLIGEMIVGYRKTLIDGGLALDVADQMAREYSGILFTAMQAKL